MPLTVVLNGKSRTFADLGPNATLDLLVAALGLQGDRVAVEWNGGIVSRSKWEQTALAENDRLEVVHFVGGGCGSGVPERARNTGFSGWLRYLW